MIDEYKATLTKPLTLVTNIFLLRNHEVLLGFKKRGFGKGYYVGMGGKVNPGESVEQAAVRELYEEAKVQIDQSELTKAAVIAYYFPHVPDESWNLQMHVFTANSLSQNPIETDEIKPVWFPKDELPLNQMWDDAKSWIPRILEGTFVEEEYVYNEQLQVIEQRASDVL